MIQDYESLSIDNYKCYEVQKAIDAERAVFQDLIREPGQRNQTRFTKACVKTQQCIAALPSKYSDIGEDRYARTWNLRNGYYGYVEYRDKLLTMSAAQAMGHSEAYFCYRIEKAKAMMADPRININDIGAACGYSDSNYFARVFKRITGQTPSDYRLAAAEKALNGF